MRTMTTSRFLLLRPPLPKIHRFQFFNKIENEGTLALKWKAMFISANAPAPLSDLAKVIDVYVLPSETELTMPADRNLADYTKVGTVAEFVNTIGETTKGGLGLTIGEADIDGVISFGLSTNHNTAYLAAEFASFKFTVDESAANFAQFNFKPAEGYVYTEGDEAKLICMNEGYTTYWDAAAGVFKLHANA